MRKIVHLLDSASRDGGGMFESVLVLCHGVGCETGWQSSVVACEDTNLADDRARWGTVPLHIVSQSGFGWLGNAWTIARVARELSPQVLHLHGIWGPTSLAALWSLRGRSEPRLVLTPHGMLEPWALSHHRLRKSLGWSVWLKRLLDRVDCLHALSEEERESLRRLLPDHPIAVVPNGVTPPAAAGLADARRDKIVLFLGRIHPKKGLVELIDAWSSPTLEAARASGWRLVIAGWDHRGHEAALKAQARQLGLRGSVAFVGPVFGDAKDQLLRSASVSVLPSRSEGLPIAVLEAWSYAVPMLMTGECHLPDGFAENAAVHCEAAQASIAAGLSTLLLDMDEGARRAMGRRGRALVERRFTTDRVGAEAAELYDWLIGGRRPDTVSGARRVSA